MQKVVGSDPFIRSMYPIAFRGAVAEGLRHGSAKPDTPVASPAGASHLLPCNLFPCMSFVRMRAEPCVYPCARFLLLPERARRIPRAGSHIARHG